MLHHIKDFPILLVGYAGCGKDTVANYLVEKYGYTKKASGDKLRELQEKINPLVENSYNTEKGSKTESIIALNSERVVEYKRYNEWLAIYGYEDSKYKVSGFRQSLVDLGESLRKVFGQDVWINQVCNEEFKNNINKRIVIADGRNKYEANRARICGGIIIKILRKDAANEIERLSVADVDPDYTINNTGTGQELYISLDGIMNLILQ